VDDGSRRIQKRGKWSRGAGAAAAGGAQPPPHEKVEVHLHGHRGADLQEAEVRFQLGAAGDGATAVRAEQHRPRLGPRQPGVAHFEDGVQLGAGEVPVWCKQGFEGGGGLMKVQKGVGACGQLREPPADHADYAPRARADLNHRARRPCAAAPLPAAPIGNSRSSAQKRALGGRGARGGAGGLHVVVAARRAVAARRVVAARRRRRARAE